MFTRISDFKERSIKDAFRFAFFHTYPLDGFDPVDPKGKNMGRGDVTSIQKFPKYREHPATYITSFFGIPNRQIDEKQSLGNIAKNLVGWPGAKGPTWKKVLSGIFGWNIGLAWNVAMILPKTVLNIAKFFTEYLPLAGANLLASRIAKLKEEKKPIERGFAIGAYVFLRGLHFIGQAITSPVKGIRTGWAVGNMLNANIVNDGTNSNKPEYTTKGKVAGAALAITSGLISACAYTILFPLGIKLLATTVIPYLPSAVTTAAGYAVNALSPVLAPLGNVMSAIGNAFTPALHAIGLKASPIVAGMAATFAVGIAAIGPLKMLKDKFSAWKAKRDDAKKTAKELKKVDDAKKAMQEKEQLLIESQTHETRQDEHHMNETRQVKHHMNETNILKALNPSASQSKLSKENTPPPEHPSLKEYPPHEAFSKSLSGSFNSRDSFIAHIGENGAKKDVAKTSSQSEIQTSTEQKKRSPSLTHKNKEENE